MLALLIHLIWFDGYFEKFIHVQRIVLSYLCYPPKYQYFVGQKNHDYTFIKFIYFIYPKTYNSTPKVFKCLLDSCFMGLKSSHKLKGQWSSRNFFGVRSGDKVRVVERMVTNADDGAAEGSAVLDKFMDGCSMEDQTLKPGPIHKLRSTGSKILSFMRFSTSSGKLLPFSANV